MKDFLKMMAHKTDWMKTFVGVTFVLVSAWVVFRVFTSDIPHGNTEIVHFIAGEVFGVSLTVANYYFSSSKGSQNKQELINKMNEEK